MEIIEANSTKEARILFEELYDIKTCGRAKKENIGINNFYLLSVFELNDKFENIWNGERTCLYCKSTFTKFNRDKSFSDKYIDADCCSPECENKYREYKNTKYDFDYYKKLSVDDSNTFFIYRVNNKKTNMCYIGQTTRHYLYRWSQHVNNTSDAKFHQALDNSSITDWSFEVLEELKDVSISFLTERENYWVNFYDSKENGYNTLQPIRDLVDIRKENLEDYLNSDFFQGKK